MIETLQRMLHDELPITQHLGVRAVHAKLEQVILSAPLAENRNHKGTAFAGSLNAVATLAAWSWFWVFLEHRREAAQVVVQDSSIRYRRPVTTDFEARCAAPSMATIDHFLATYQRSGRGRLVLQVDLSDRTGVAATFSGRFIAEKTTGAAGAARD